MRIQHGLQAGLQRLPLGVAVAQDRIEVDVAQAEQLHGMAFGACALDVGVGHGGVEAAGVGVSQNHGDAFGHGSSLTDGAGVGAHCAGLRAVRPVG